MGPANSRMRLVLVIVVLCAEFACNPRATVSERPAQSAPVTRESKPWTRWWWHGSAVTKEGLTAEMEAYQRAGIGGLEITPIYGVYGEEENFIEFLSPRWMELFAHVLKEAERLDLGIDMATGTGWPFGGPRVTDADASKNLQYRIYELEGGGSLQEPIRFVQPPYLRMVGNNIYRDGKRIFNTDETKITDLIEPVSRNPDLQKLAIDQVQFEKPLVLKCVVAYGGNSEKVDLTDRVGENGQLDWTAPPGTWKLYAVFQGFHGKMVERAGPGGEGYVIDHFSDDALRNYLYYFDNAFQKQDLKSLRAFFNDSYEVDDARGAADFTPALFEEFEKRRGYDLKTELPALFGKDEKARNERVLCDYRETISELLLEKFTRTWKEWAHKNDAFVRNQAHGSPSNILDLYWVVDIPEIEGTEPLRLRMASSSGNVTGKKLVSAEAGTWLNEHFQSGLGDIRQALDNFMLNGVNHVVYHGTCYSPPAEPWPGRLFYASVHLNPRNPQWKDFHALNAYVARCQALLQSTSPDNDVLLYYPIYDRFSSQGPEMIEHFDGIGGFKGSVFEKTAESLLSQGFGFDYISDKQLQDSDAQNGALRTSGNSLYRVILVPACNYMPLTTLEKLLSLSRAGVKVLFIGKKPASVSGFTDLENRAMRFGMIMQGFADELVISADSGMANVLTAIGARRENMVDMGIQCLRKQLDGELFYLIRNATGKHFEGWIPITSPSRDILLLDPMRDRSGAARTRATSSGTEVFVQIEKAGTRILRGLPEGDGSEYPYRQRDGEAVTIKGRWLTVFESGGPERPPSFDSEVPMYWTDLRDERYKNFSGTAAYESKFMRPASKNNRWLLALDSVKGTAEVFLNGKSVATLLGPVYETEFDGSLLEDENVLTIKVSNLMANRIAYMDRNHIFWKKFYNINFAARRRENTRNNIFDASQWKPRVSGMSGRVRLYPLK